MDLLYDLRHGDDPYSKLLRRHRLSTRKAHWYLGSNLVGGTRGRRVRASKTDRLVRELWFPTPTGDVRKPIRGSRAATELANFRQDRGKLLAGKLSADEFQSKWWGVQIDGREVFADADQILRMADEGVLKLETLYASVESAE